MHLRMKSIMSKKLFVLLFVATLARASYGEVISSWEGVDDGSIDWGNKELVSDPCNMPVRVTGNAGYDYSTIGATEGSQSLEVTTGWDTQYAVYQCFTVKPNYAGREAFKDNNKFSIDFTVPAGTSGGRMQIYEIVLNAEVLGWNVMTVETSDSSGNLYFDMWDGSPERTMTLSFDYDASPLGGAVPGYLEIIISLQDNGCATPNFYFDNAQVTFTYAATGTIDANTHYQDIEGFGAAGAWYESWLTSNTESEALYDLFFDELGLDIYRIRNTYDYDSGYMSNTSTIVAEALERNPNLKIMITSWSPPTSLKSTGSLDEGTLAGGPSNYVYDDFALWWYNSIDSWTTTYGVEPDYINIQNEPDYDGNNRCLFDPTENSTNAGYDQAFETVWTKLDTEMGSSIPKMLATEITGFEGANGYSPDDYLSAIIDHNHVYGYAHHLYNCNNGGQPGCGDDPDQYVTNMTNFNSSWATKPLFQTEYEHATDSWPDALNIALLIHNSLTVEQVSGYLYWQLFWSSSGLVTIPSYGASTYTINSDFYGFKHFSAFIHSDWDRIYASQDSNDLRISAYISPDNNEMSVVVINTGASDFKLDLSFTGFSISSGSIYRTSSSQNCVNIGSYDGSSPVTLPGSTVTTLSLAGSGATLRTLTTSSTSGGYLTIPGEGAYDYSDGTNANIVAVASSNYDFVNWTGTAVTAGKVADANAASTTVTADADYTLMANFANFAEPDLTAPVVANLSPASDSIQVPINSLIYLDITDSGAGVDAATVTIEVDSNLVYTGDTDDCNTVYGHCRRIGTNAAYTYIYQADESFNYDQTVNVTVNASDLAPLGSNPMTEYSYSFKTEMRSFGQNKRVSDVGDDLGSSTPATASDSSGNIWVVWHTGQTGSRDIYIGKLTVGADSFSSSVQVTNNGTDQCNPVIAIDGTDKLYVAWQDNQQGEWDIYISTSTDGTNFSAETKITDPNSNQINPAIAIDSSNTVYVAWEDDQNTNQDIYIASSSNSFASQTTSQITSDTSSQTSPAIAADSNDTVYAVWTDTRGGTNDIYGADSNNGPWTNVVVVSNANDQSSPTIATEASGTILHFLWVDDTPGDSDIYYASSDGLPGSPLSGSSVVDDSSGAEQSEPVIVVTGSTGNSLKVFACWKDERNVTNNNGDTDIYFVENSDSETNVFVGDDSTNSAQSSPAMAVDGDGYPYMVWTDGINADADIYYAGSTFAESTAQASEDVTAASPEVTIGTELANIDDVTDVSVTIPAGACPHDVAITISKVSNPAKISVNRLSSHYEFGPSGIEFDEPVTIIIPYEVTSSQISPSAYWYDILLCSLSQEGISNIEIIEISPTLNALRFQTTHFTQFLVGGEIIGGGGGGGGGCSMSPNSQGNIVEFLLPYFGLAVVMTIIKLRDKQRKKTHNIIESR